MSSYCPCLEDDMKEMNDLEEDIDQVYEPDEEQPLSDEQQDNQANIHFSKLNQWKK
jgi:hypothetical protein